MRMLWLTAVLRKPLNVGRILTVAMFLAVSTLPSTPVAGEDPAVPSDSQSQQIEAWVKLLDSDVYADRQSAMQNLKRSGAAGVAALAKVARGSNLEVTVRAINLLTQMYESPDQEVALAAEDALESLAQYGPPVAVVRTQEVLMTTLARLRRQYAIAAIRRLGGHVIPKIDQDDEGQDIEADLNEEDSVQHVVLGKKWKGGLEGLKYLLRLPELRVRVLYVTNDIPLTTEELGVLKERMAGIRIESRGSAYLGITSLIQDPDICLIHTVVPNSPAKQAGLRPGDLITHVDGLPIRGFPELTSTLSLKRGGDAVYLEVQRGEESLEIEARLGEW